MPVAVAGQGLHHRVEPGRGSHGHRGPPELDVAAVPSDDDAERRRRRGRRRGKAARRGDAERRRTVRRRTAWRRRTAPGKGCAWAGLRRGWEVRRSGARVV